MCRPRLLLLTGLALLAVLTGVAGARVPPDVLVTAQGRLTAAFARREVPYPPRAVTLIALKAEGRLELWAEAGSGWRFVRSYLVRRTSGALGPKLRQGDYQVPEGVYRVDWLNPDSHYHLSMRLDYPNAFDRARADEDGRTRLGGDIMIHGGSRSVGCLPVGDSAVEEIYALVARVGAPNVAVVVSPVDLRLIAPADAAARAGQRPRWLAGLYETIAEALHPFALPADEAAPASRRPAVAKARCTPWNEADCVRRCAKRELASCARVGLMYREGRGARADDAKAWTFLRRACSGGDAFGCAQLAQLYVTDDGLRRDVSRAAALAAAACDAGDGHGCSVLVRLCEERIIYAGARDQCSAQALRRLSARATASLRRDCRGWGAYDCATLATMFAPTDRGTAVRFATRSCDAGDPGGCHELGRLYEDEGDVIRAHALYRRACDAGSAAACERVATPRAG